MNSIVKKALALWGLEGAHFHLVAARENAVYQVTSADNQVALRLHRQGYRGDDELASELSWMAAVATAGVSVPAPIHAIDGRMMHIIEGVQVDALTWLNGVTMSEALEPLKDKNKCELFFDIGCEMARLHQASDKWAKPIEFKRIHWNADGFLGKAPLWDKFWKNPELTKHDHDLCDALREKAWITLTNIGPSLDYGLIHADLVPANIMVDGKQLRFIDFDDGGFGYRIFELATALNKHIDAQNYSDLQSSMINGYRSIRPLKTEELDLFLALRAATYVGWNISRMNEEGGRARNLRFIKTLRVQAEKFLDSTT